MTGDVEARVDRLCADELAFVEEAPDHPDDSALSALFGRIVGILGETDILRYAAGPTGGGLPSMRTFCAVRERLARHHGLCDLAFAMQGLASVPISLAGTDAQREAHLPGLADGRTVGAFAITEEEAGSDVVSMRTEARPTDDGAWTLHGRKTFITNAGVADLHVLFAKTDPEAGKRGLSAFLVDPGAEGFSLEATQEVTAPHPIGTIRLDGVRVGPDDLLGEEGGGLRLALEALTVCRPGVGAAACGFALRALEESVERAASREQFGRPIADHQGIRFYLAEMATDLEAARLLVRKAARLRDEDADGADRASAMAKLQATELAQTIVDKAVQIHGGRGVLVGTVPERLYRDVRALRIYEGTSEIQKLVIARDLLEHGVDPDGS